MYIYVLRVHPSCGKAYTGEQNKTEILPVVCLDEKIQANEANKKSLQFHEFQK